MDLCTIGLALRQIGSFEVILAIVIGSIFGTFVGALPGMGTVVALVMALPFTYSIPRRSRSCCASIAARSMADRSRRS